MVYFIPIFNYLLIVCRNTIDLDILILTAAYLLLSLINSGSRFVDAIEFSTYVIMSSGNKNSFISFFPIWMFCCCVSCYITLLCFLLYSKTIWNRNEERKHICLVLELREKAISVSPLNTMLTVGFPTRPCQIEEVSF